MCTSFVYIISCEHRPKKVPYAIFYNCCQQLACSPPKKKLALVISQKQRKVHAQLYTYLYISACAFVCVRIKKRTDSPARKNSLSSRSPFVYFIYYKQRPPSLVGAYLITLWPVYLKH